MDINAVALDKPYTKSLSINIFYKRSVLRGGDLLLNPRYIFGHVDVDNVLLWYKTRTKTMYCSCSDAAQLITARGSIEKH